MLVLSRQEREQIVIGGSVVVTVLEIRGNRIKLGITAPSEVIVMRGELVDQAEWPNPPPETLKNRLQRNRLRIIPAKVPADSVASTDAVPRGDVKQGESQTARKLKTSIRDAA